MTGNWRDDEPSTPERIRGGARTLVKLGRSGVAATVAVAVVAVVLVVTLIWVSVGGEASPPPARESAKSASASKGPEPTEGVHRIRQAEDECLRLSRTEDGSDRDVLARGKCEGDAARFRVTRLSDTEIRIGFVHDDFKKKYCLQADGPGKGDKPGIYYYAPYECADDQKLQVFTVLPGKDGTVRLKTPGDQCLDVYEDYEFADGKVVATADCSNSATQPLRFGSA